MKRILITIIVLLFLVGCGPQTDVPAGRQISTQESSEPEVQRTPEDAPATSHGTPINSSTDIDELPMQDTPNSSCFSQVGYPPGQEVLYVTFRDSGATYAYYDVPESVWDEFWSASSMGRYYNQEIKGAYDCEKIS